ncbi:hypothetical protein SEUCBS139899_003039 [Sporothrix eucalyptigena]|uniref:Enoyl reductase (ER) domain-containing protein n=1 Tax=Sporothrix eucalyptigena TaxID=1812306 RepID=A0ABP0CM76_9PEZI
MTAEPINFVTYCGSKANQVVPVKTTRSIGARECLVEVTHSGYCATDTYFTGVPMGLGHEGVGVVRQLGPAVTQHKVGDRVGWGFVHEACFNCKQCLSGGEIYCLKRKMYGYGNLDQGSLATHAVWDENFLFPIPDAMTSADAAPLMCAGASVFGSLQQRGYKSSDRCGIVGIGGLGHLAIQFAHKMGMEVVTFSTTEAKREEALAFGADEFYVLPRTAGAKLPEGIRRLDHLLVCSTAQPDWHVFLNVLEPRATIYPLTAFEKDVTYPHLDLIFSGVTIQGTMIATKQGYVDMLRFCIQHKIKPVNQEYPMTVEGIEKCNHDLKAGTIRYRGVLVAEGADRSGETVLDPETAKAEPEVTKVTVVVDGEKNGVTNGSSGHDVMEIA